MPENTYNADQMGYFLFGHSIQASVDPMGLAYSIRTHGILHKMNHNLGEIAAEVGDSSAFFGRQKKCVWQTCS